jgi:hypothetical protein
LPPQTLLKTALGPIWHFFPFGFRKSFRFASGICPAPASAPTSSCLAPAPAPAPAHVVVVVVVVPAVGVVDKDDKLSQHDDLVRLIRPRSHFDDVSVRIPLNHALLLLHIVMIMKMTMMMINLQGLSYSVTSNDVIK